MIRRVILALMAALLLTGPAMADRLYTDDPDNPARVGAWRISCDHDGNLHGRDFEACHAWVNLPGGTLTFYRNPRDASIVMQISGCQDGLIGSTELDVKLVSPEVADREGQLIRAFRRSASKAAKACHRAAPSLDRASVRADLAKVLKLTDGLEDYGDRFGSNS